MLEQIRTYRRDLHQIPELGFDLGLTHAYIEKELIRLGYHPFTMAKSGLIAIKEGLSKEAIAFRSDMDALPVTELNEISFKSTHPGKMHACGHDGHMAMLLTFASELAKIKVLKKTVVLIFQPAEEGPGGAIEIINEGLFDKYDIKSVFGLHLFPGIKEGKIGLVDGYMTAQNGEFDIEVHGVSAHGAQPHLGKDSIIASTFLIQAYQTLLSRNLNPLDSAVITVGTIESGEARNIISNLVKMSGTIRAFKPSVYGLIKKRIAEINQGIEVMYGVKVDCAIRDYYPAVYNDHEVFEKVANSFNTEVIEYYEPLMIAEDFAFYQQKVPGLFAYIGTMSEEDGYTYPLHSNRFNFNEEALLQGVYFYKQVAKVYQILD